jgi:hypothetical protein
MIILKLCYFWDVKPVAQNKPEDTELLNLRLLSSAAELLQAA